MGDAAEVSRVLTCAVSAATAAGKAIMELRDAGKTDFSYKDGTEPVSRADLLADDIITRMIRHSFPEHTVFSEETTGVRRPQRTDSGPLWVIDPVDGTANYVRGNPHVAISIAFAVDGEVRAGVVHAPFMGETFTAVKDRGALLNGHPIAVAAPPGLARSVVSTGFPHRKGELAPLVERVRRLLANCEDIRRGSSPVLDIAWVGAGRLDAHTESLFPWDVAAAALIATEAGAVRSHLVDVPLDVPVDLFGEGVVVAAPSIHSDLVDLLSVDSPM